MKLDPAILAVCPDTPEVAVPFLRRAGLSKVQSIGAIYEKFGLPLAEAKSLVHFHEAWADRQAADEAFHEAVSDALKTDT